VLSVRNFTLGGRDCQARMFCALSGVTLSLSKGNAVEAWMTRIASLLFATCFTRFDFGLDPPLSA
jgi:hypothetical protein